MQSQSFENGQSCDTQVLSLRMHHTDCACNANAIPTNLLLITQNFMATALLDHAIGFGDLQHPHCSAS